MKNPNTHPFIRHGCDFGAMPYSTHTRTRCHNNAARHIDGQPNDATQWLNLRRKRAIGGHEQKGRVGVPQRPKQRVRERERIGDVSASMQIRIVVIYWMP